jgi:exonuclease III
MTDKPLTLTSLNVRGLRGGKSKPKEIKAWLASLPTPPQIVLIQEHHLGKEDAQGAAKGMEFWRESAFWNEGIPLGRSHRVSAGTAILVDKAIAPLITAHGTLMEGRAQFITLQAPDNGTLTIVNVYAPQSSNDRARLWQKIHQADLVADHIILGGNCNHHEGTDWSSATGARPMHIRESASWHHMTLRYGLTDAWHLDSFRKLTKKAFTYDNGSHLRRLPDRQVHGLPNTRGKRGENRGSGLTEKPHGPLATSHDDMGVTQRPHQPLTLLRCFAFE